MAIARDQRWELAEQIVAAGDGPLGYALQTADHMAIDDIVRALEEHVAWENGAQCDRFITEWLPRLQPVQRLAAALAVEGLYITALVWLPHAEDRGLQQVLQAGSAALGRLSEQLRLEGSQLSPDVSFGPDFVNKLSDLVEGPLTDSRSTLQSLTTDLAATQNEQAG